MRHRLLTALVALSLSALPAAAAEPPRIVIDHQVLYPAPDSQPFIANGRTLVPLRAIFEYLGATVHWDGTTQTVTARKGNTVLILQVDSPTASVNGKTVTLDQPAKLVENRVFVPLRLVGEAFGANVNWYEANPGDWTPTVAITTRPQEEPGPLTFTPAPGALQQRTAAPGQPLIATDEGIGFLNLATGEAVSYAIPGGNLRGPCEFSPAGDCRPDGAQPRTVGYGASPDGRFVIARGIEDGYILDRQSGQTQRWDHLAYDLVTAGKEHLLFQAVTPNPTGWVNHISPNDGHLEGFLTGTARFIVTDGALKPVAEFTLPPASGYPANGDAALFDQSERKVMLSWGMNTYLVDLTTGNATAVTSTAQLQPAKGGAEVVAVQATRHGTTITRYDWKGQVLAQNLIPAIASRVKVSGDGEWVAWDVTLEQFTPVVYLARLGEMEKAYQALGATICYGSIGSGGARWLPGANGPSLVVGTREGLRTISTTGSVQALSVPEEFVYFDPVPAPGSEPLYGFRRYTTQGYELGALTPDGKLLATVRTQSATGIGASSRFSSLWGGTAAELRLHLTQQQGGGAPCGDYSMPLSLKVYAPGTYDGNLVLQVVAPGDCVAIREQPWFDSPMLRCLPDGERIVLGNHASESLPAFHHNADGQWFQLPEGWIRVSSGFVQFAD